MKVFRELFSSKRFLVGLGAILSVIADKVFHLELGDERIASIVAVAGMFIAGQSYEEGKRVEGVTTPPNK